MLKLWRYGVTVSGIVKKMRRKNWPRLVAFVQDVVLRATGKQVAGKYI